MRWRTFSKGFFRNVRACWVLVNDAELLGKSVEFGGLLQPVYLEGSTSSAVKGEKSCSRFSTLSSSAARYEGSGDLLGNRVTKMQTL